MASRGRRVDRVVPVAVEAMRLDVDAGELLVRDLDGLLIEVSVDRGLDAEPGLGPGTSDQADDGLDTLQRTATPILGDVAEHPVLDLVPLARTGWVVRDRHVETRLVREALEFQFPQPRAVAVAAASVCGEQQSRGVGIGISSHAPPPATDGLDCEFGRVVVDADVDPSFVASDVVDAVRNRLAESLVDEVVHAHRLRLARRAPLLATVGEISDEFLLLGVHGDHRLTGTLKAPRLRVDVLELLVAIGVFRALAHLARPLQAVLHAVQQLADLLRTYLVSHRAKLLGELTDALARPTQRRFGIATRQRLYEGIQVPYDRRILLDQQLATRARTAHPLLARRIHRRAESHLLQVAHA